MQRIYVAGHNGMVGSAIIRQLDKQPDTTIVTRSHTELDLTNQVAVNDFFTAEQFDQVYIAAAKVGGIHANNTYPAEFIYENLMIECNLIHAAHQSNIDKLLFLGSSCIYPKLASQPMHETELLTGFLEPTNEPYAIAKIAGIKLCESYNRQYGRDYRSAMPTNLYGPNDNFHPENSHVIPALIRRFHEAAQSNSPSVTIWGTGNARREFLHVDDMASAAIQVMQQEKITYDGLTQPMLSHINMGSGEDFAISELAQMIATISHYQGHIVFDVNKPDGAPRKLLDVTKLKSLGWSPKFGLHSGLEDVYKWYCANEAQ